MGYAEASEVRCTWNAASCNYQGDRKMRRIVDDRWDRQNFVSRIGQVALATETVIYAWALMTNH